MEEEKARASSALIECVQEQVSEPKRTKLGEFVDFVRWSFSKLEMRKFFKWFGQFIGNFPIPSLIAFGIMLSLIAFAFPMNLRDRVRDGYTPADSKAYHESRQLREFSGLIGDPMMTSVMLRARDKSSMIEQDNLMEAVRLLQHVKQNISVSSEGKEHNRYTDFCGHHCRQNDVVDFFALELAKFRDGTSSSILKSNLTYPMATILTQKVNLERNFYGVKTSFQADRTYTNIDYCELILLTFTADITKPHEEEIVARWELEVSDYAAKRSKDEKVEMLVIGAEIVDLEMNKDSQRMTPYFAIGFAGAAVFIFISAWFSLFLYGRLSPEFRGCGMVTANMLLPVFVCVVPACAILTTFGIYGLLGLRINSLMLIMPFLIMGIGVNDSFLVVHHWLRERTSLTRTELLGLVFEDVGPSITMTTLTNVISFAIGACAPTAEIALFCAGSAIAMGLAYIYTLLFFGALLAFYSAPEGSPEPKKSHRQKMVGNFFDKMLLFYSKLLQNNIFRTVFLLVWIGFIIGGIVGCTTITSKLETEKILPHETPIRLPNRIIEEQVWPEYYPVIIMVHRPFDVSDKALNAEFMQMVDEFEGLEGSRGPNSTLLWLRNYQEYFDMVASGNEKDIFGDSDEDEADDIKKGEYDNSQIEGFLGSPMTKHFRGMMVVDSELSPPVRKFSFLVAYRNHTTWDDRIRIQEEWRAICGRHPNLNVTIWNVNGMFVDQMQSLKKLAAESIVATLAAMVVVTFIFIQKPVPVAVAVLSIGSIAIGTIGYIAIWELDLDPVTICAILISIGMSVDFTAHISMYFVNCPRRHDGLPPTSLDRLIHSIGSICWPAIQGNLSTLICVVPLVALNNYIPLVFVKTLTLVVIIGTAHGLLLIPMFLSLLPASMLEWDLLSSRKPADTVAINDRSTIGRELQCLGVDACATKSAEEPLL
ncbi:hypothetical protein PENTCL1PPCAC_24354, partial [Pristionchus entomophagus]